MITEARMNVSEPNGPNVLININEKVDKDIAFDPESGSFAFRLRSQIGESVIPDLVERLVRVERLVEFIQVLQKHERALKCESASLGKIVFTYGNISVSHGLDAMELDAHPYKATVDFSVMENNMTLVLERGNPHLRISDFLAKVLNGSEGLDGVASVLPLTLPVLRGLDGIENAWTPAPDTDKGEVFVNVRAVDWYMIRYNLKQPVPAPESPPRIRKIMLEVKLKHRRGDPWWYVKRSVKQSDIASRSNKETDDIDVALKSVWTSEGPGWRGMLVSAVAQINGVEELLGKLDEVIRNLPVPDDAAPAAAPAAVPTAVPPKQHARAQAPKQQQRQQQPTPNQGRIQGQSQGRNKPFKQEIVEID